MKTITIQGRVIEVIGDGVDETTPIESLDFGYNLINIRPGQPRRYEWFKDHTSSKSVLATCWKMADICRLNPHHYYKTLLEDKEI